MTPLILEYKVHAHEVNILLGQKLAATKGSQTVTIQININLISEKLLVIALLW